MTTILVYFDEQTETAKFAIPHEDAEAFAFGMTTIMPRKGDIIPQRFNTITRFEAKPIGRNEQVLITLFLKGAPLVDPEIKEQLRDAGVDPEGITNHKSKTVLLIRTDQGLVLLQKDKSVEVQKTPNPF